ncbi:hypothetical protein ES319_A12G253600v1 [Gossypium barbadense]|uniref:Uncharacterized protein n=2 Tax=Gossypium TaxID=3633 RepID=A0A2P5VWF7_GOSBA|nr:hypothetical protein ES319_A12G253600v1 [Gossypium barbadense]PPR83164.1 hypothetical protein GOBAR_AA37554 [Gossypium barbadense]TYG91594.1 hypothetical protein ES288_A12G274800v1 [Gossypium darwinii]
MSEGSKAAMNVFSIPAPSSRLSPLARPFTITSPFNRHESFDPLLDSTSGLDQPFPYLNLGGQRQQGYCAYDSDSTAITATPFVNDLDFEPNSCFTNNPFVDPLVQTSFTPSSSSLNNVDPESGVLGTATNHHGLQGNLLQQGLIFSSRPQHTQSKLSSSAPVLSMSHCDSTIINNERCFPNLASCAAETLVSCAPKHFAYSARTFKPSSSSYNPPIVNPVPLENVAYGGTDALSKTDSYFGYVMPGMIGSDIMQSPLDKVACQDLLLRTIVEPACNETKSPSIMEKSKLQIACPNVHEDLALEQHDAKAGIADDKCSTNSDDLDVDSPCWPGTQAYKSPFSCSVPVNSEDSKGQSPFRVSVSPKLEHSKNKKVARNSLNPLAPVFIPGNSKQKADYLQKDCHGDNSLASQNIGALAAISSSRENELLGSARAGTCPSERINDIGFHFSIDAHDSRLEYGSPCSFQPPGKESVISESQLENVAGCMEGIANATYNALDSVADVAQAGPSSSISFPTTEISLTSHSIGDGVFSDLTQRFQEPSKSTPPKLDVNLMINTIQFLSELLLQNYSFALGSMSEYEHDKILNIINNLYGVIRHWAGERGVRPESSHLSTLYGKRQAADHREYKIQVNKKEHEIPPEALFYRQLWLEAKEASNLMKYRAHGSHTKPEPEKC